MDESNNLVEFGVSIPAYTVEDYKTLEPYKWLYSLRTDEVEMEIARSEMAEHAKSIGVKNFSSMWRAFLKMARGANKIIPADHVTEYTDQPMELNSGVYRCTDSGVTLTDKFGTETTIITHPIMPVMRIKNIESGEERIRLAYNTDNRWEYITVPNETLSNAQKIITLSGPGLSITSENARDMVRFMSDIKDRNRDRIPTQRATSHLGWQQDGTFSPFGEGIIYDGDNMEYQHIFESIEKPHGDEAAWMELAKAVRTGKSVPARIALAASFAAPLVSKLGGLPFFVHLWGTQGCGKTVGLMLAASVWGDPVIGKYPKTFQATKVALEGLAAFCGNIPVIYDELQVIGDRQLFDDLIYMLCEGASKGRGTKDGGLQIQKRWCTTIITSGEMPIVQENSGGGAAVRTIEVNYGGQPLFNDAHKVVEILTSNYGFAGRKIVKSLEDSETLIAIKEKREEFYNLLLGNIDEKQALAASILLTADWLANKAVFNDDKSLMPKDIGPYLITKAAADKQRRCYEWLMGHIAANDARFDASSDNKGECWGVIEDDTIYFIRSSFDACLRKAGYSTGAFLTWAKKEGLIKCEHYGDDIGGKRMTMRKRIKGARVTCVALVRTDTDGEDENGFVQVDPGEELPFM